MVGFGLFPTGFLPLIIPRDLEVSWVMFLGSLQAAVASEDPPSMLPVVSDRDKLGRCLKGTTSPIRMLPGLQSSELRSLAGSGRRELIGSLQGPCGCLSEMAKVHQVGSRVNTPAMVAPGDHRAPGDGNAAQDISGLPLVPRDPRSCVQAHGPP